MRLVLAFVVAMGLGAGPAWAQVDHDPVALITALYKTYQENTPALGGAPSPACPTSPASDSRP